MSIQQIEANLSLELECEDLINKSIVTFVRCNQAKPSQSLPSEIVRDTLYERYRNERKMLCALRAEK